ncbi:BRCT domain-containing protein At4g02110 isoform X2 [Rhodamnia argentea]|uniref:BRCT domain-containing protein At4g02110 isoform X2 n=1 Tax=Rhodamnia argentea TaxID=178133 RepID=A0A8B8PCI5_9MYRT|nr:BRCT domain-containing protein At4g02110 isoform X2 [Rhodamnia argentea]
MLGSASPSKPFHGVRFVLFGFDPDGRRHVLSKLVDGGGVDAGEYGPNCSHVVVDRIVYDDPVCVAAREDGKVVVTGLWVDHSYDIGMPVDASSIMYRPLKDLNGIPGAESLIMCLTGYQRQDRDDIMTMVGLMGAQFSKPLVANKVTHLFCYKFEGEKYELAKKIKTIKLVNHRWLEDCLRDWEILPEANYSKSGYESEMEAEAKDSEEEAEEKQPMENAECRSPFNLKVGISSSSVPLSAAKLSKAPLGLNEMEGQSRASSAKYLSVTPTKPAESPSVRNDLNRPSISISHDVSPLQTATSGSPTEVKQKTPALNSSKEPCASGSVESSEFDAKHGALSYSRKTPRRTSFPLHAVEGSAHANSSLRIHPCELDGDIENSSFKAKARDDVGNACIQTPSQNLEAYSEESKGTPAQKTPEVSRSQTSYYEKLCISGNPLTGSKTEGSEARGLIDHHGGAHDLLYPRNGAHCTNEPADVNSVGNKSTCISTNKSNRSNEVSVANQLPFANIVNVDAERDKNDGEKIAQTSSGGPGKLASVSPTAIGQTNVEEPIHQTGEIGKQPWLPPAKISTQTHQAMDVEKPSEKPTKFDFLERSGDKVAKTPLGKKVAERKTLGSKTKVSKSANTKGSIYPRKAASSTDAMNSSNGRDNIVISDKSPDNHVDIAHAQNGIALSEGLKDIMQDEDGIKDIMDEDTEAPEDKDDHALEEAINEGNPDGYQSIQKEDVHMEETSNCLVKETNISGDHMPDDATKSKEGSSSEKRERTYGKTYGLKKSNLKAAIEGKFIKGTKSSSGKKLKTVPDAKGKMECNVGLDGRASSLPHTERRVEEHNGISCSSGSGRSCTVKSNKFESSIEVEKENQPVLNADQKSSINPSRMNRQNDEEARKNCGNSVAAETLNRKRTEPAWFILSGHKQQRKEFQQVARRLRGRLCANSHKWSYQATHFISPDPVRRTEKFFAAAASGRWILKPEYLIASSEAGKFLAEEPYEWHKNGLSQDGAINLEAPRKWRLLRERTGHGAFHEMRIIIYGECITPPLDTLKRVVKAGDGAILATSPPYDRFLNTRVDFAIISPGMPRVDVWVQEFLKHEIPCIAADYLVEYVCKPGYSLEKHVLYGTHAWAEKSFTRLQSKAEEVVNLTPPDDGGSDICCQVCGSSDRGVVMLICGDESGSVGCGIGTHIDCCNPPFKVVPEEDWLCSRCIQSAKKTTKSAPKRKRGTAS